MISERAKSQDKKGFKLPVHSDASKSLLRIKKTTFYKAHRIVVTQFTTYSYRLIIMKLLPRMSSKSKNKIVVTIPKRDLVPGSKIKLGLCLY